IESHLILRGVAVWRQRGGIVSRAFGDDADRVRFTTLVSLAEKFDYNLRLHWHFRHDDGLSSTRNPRRQRQVTAVTSHDFDQKRSVMRTGRDFDSINSFKTNIESGIHTYRHFRSQKVVIDRRTDSYHT